MSLESNVHNHSRKRDWVVDLLKRPFSRSPVQGTSTNDEHPPVALQSEIGVHHGPIYNTTNTGNGTVNNIGHIQTANFHMGTGGPDALLWNSLPRQRDTSGQSHGYLKGSRERDVQEILQWIDNAPAGELVLWIRGGAGVGKSTLARHLTHVLREDNRLAASISFSAVPNDARGPESIVKLIARDMGTIHPTTIPLILAAISSCHGAPFREYLEKYILHPVHALRSSGSFIFLLDAVDEWEYYETFMKELAWMTASSTSLKFILLGRSDPQKQGHKDAWLRSYQLQPIADRIMERYFVKELNSVQWSRGWMPTKTQISKLVKLADGLFLWAVVVCSLLKRKLSRSSPSEMLESIVDSRRSITAEAGLSTLYHQSIIWLFPTPNEQALLRQYLGAALVLQEPLPMDSFSSLVRMPIHVVECVNAALIALQIRDPLTTGDVQWIYPAGSIFHLSFLRYLESSSTPPEISFPISATEYHYRLAESCLLELRNFLPGKQKLNRTDLSPLQEYTVKHMPTHVYKGTPSVEPVSDPDWEQKPQFSLLKDIPTPSFFQWGRLLLSLLQPSGSDRELEEDTENYGESTERLMVYFATELRKGREATLPVRIACLEVAVRLGPCHSQSWCELGKAYTSLALSTRSRGSYDRSVQAYRNALKGEGEGLSSSSEGNGVLLSLGTALHERHKRFGNPHDCTEAISVLRDALVACRAGQPERITCLNNLANSLSNTGCDSDLLESICLHREALELRPLEHPGRASSLNNLAFSLSKTGSLGDLHEAIRLYRQALELQPAGHSNRGITLSNVANSLCGTGSMSDLKEAICLFRKALELQPAGHPAHGAALDNLASALAKTGSSSDQEESMNLHRKVLKFQPPGHPNHALSLISFANSLYRLGSAKDLQESIRMYRQALEFLPSGDPQHAIVLNNLAKALAKTGSVEERRESTRLYREALALRPQGHPERCDALDNLAHLLYETGSVIDLQEAIPLYREALTLRPAGHSKHDTAQALSNLANALARTGSVENLRESIVLRWEALRLRPPGHPQHTNTLNDLVDALSETESIGDPEESAHLYRKALEIRPPGHPKRAVVLRGLADALAKTGLVHNWQEAIHLYRETLEIQQLGHLERAATIHSLACLLSRMDSLDNQNESISLYRKALKLFPRGHSQRTNTLNGLVDILVKTASISDLQESIALYREVLDLVPPGHPDRLKALDNLGNALFKAGSIGDLREMTQLYREVLELCPHGHPQRDSALANLGSLPSKMGSRHDHDPHESVPLFRDALDLVPQGYPERDKLLHNLAHKLSKTGPDLLERIRLYREALELRPSGHPLRDTTLYNLAGSLAKTGSPDDLQECIHLHREALEHRPPGHPDRHHLSWRPRARTFGRQSLPTTSRDQSN
ncbi:hypothetical protein NMY22_g4195 [Coprinellus aureogranulatus]|nr:hypothetical protein NMY22_g4195 [Coprinellus aureogranulatus]